jgi:hypothetical protein
MPSQRIEPGSESAASELAWRRRVPWWRRGLALAALIISILATVWAIAGGPGGSIGAIPTFLAAIPVYVAARSFGRAALTVALVITVLGVLGVLLGMFIYLPAAILLFLAWLSDPRPRPRIAAVLAGLGYAMLIAMTVIWSVALAHPV